MLNTVTLTIAAANGLGNHDSNLSSSELSEAMCWVWVGNATTLISISFGKGAVVAFLFAVQGEVYRTKRYILHFLCCSTVSLSVACFAPRAPPPQTSTKFRGTVE